MFYIYKSFPNQKVWETSFFVYNSGYYENVMYSAHALFSKLIPLIALLIWFFSCDKWWYHAIVPLISMYAYQLLNVINDDINLIDEVEIIYIIPIAIIISTVIYIARKKIFKREILISIYNDIEKELDARKG